MDKRQTPTWPAPVCHIRLAYNDKQFLSNQLQAYETLEPPWYRQSLYLSQGYEIREEPGKTRFGSCLDCDALIVDHVEKTASVFHNVARIPVYYEEAIAVVEELRLLIPKLPKY